MDCLTASMRIRSLAMAARDRELWREYDWFPGRHQPSAARRLPLYCDCNAFIMRIKGVCFAPVALKTDYGIKSHGHLLPGNPIELALGAFQYVNLVSDS